MTITYSTLVSESNNCPVCARNVATAARHTNALELERPELAGNELSTRIRIPLKKPSISYECGYLTMCYIVDQLQLFDNTPIAT
jgi:hypothetical protein